ncbi:4-azaleucine resistance transporter AzlC [Breznakia sp. PF5-3]|uniref:AzlC family ABC transporter permease n=1 Tax=unclassified Breznakia TaxID=2623764 RepID=UPI0024067280|nr:MULTISPECIES: AzlC family ABC transporter permease [unclassified Breznakia]MDF9824728.1 4-azaleucine resistance transporter AzlC [Breznakia sp. PM6-1]MDF9835391.1 4-azaleucine resistance transporter AzlC [Breznakia sp. PF5-3]MDF9836990.1 4-azaleucine resistance transporter AzlC [Breznakia sp. PFB2-8]MDF9859626.1 4-azaleucine resistance transporter AzlC [Breznakia sp. PH5-24]
MIEALKKAFPFTIPVMIGYVFLGIAFGILLEKAGYNFLWAILLSVVIYSGALQFVCVSFLSGGTNILSIIFISMVMNFRHCFYGLSMLEKYKETGKQKPYLIYALTDETFSLLNTVDVPEDVSKGWFYFFVSLCNQSYWVFGAAVGGLLSFSLNFNTQGIDFSMTALFVVMFIEQIKTHRTYVIGFLGIVLSFLALLLVGRDYFIVLALLLIVITLLIQKKKVGVIHE